MSNTPPFPKDMHALNADYPVPPRRQAGIIDSPDHAEDAVMESQADKKSAGEEDGSTNLGDFVQRHPASAVLAGFGVGVLLGTVVGR